MNTCSCRKARTASDRDGVQAEIKEDVRKAKEALISFAFGLLMVIPGCILLLIMLPQLVNWLVPELPMWVCYGIVGGVLAVLGGALV